MSERQSGGNTSGLGVIAVVMVFYVVGLAALTAHARYQAQQLAELSDAREIVRIENQAWSVQDAELVLDNRDLRLQLGQRPQAENYPASNDPSADPNPYD